jgi:hypothetical protein
MVGDNVGDDVGDDVGNGDDGGNNAGNNASKGDGGDAGKEGGGLLAEDAAVAAAAAAAAAATAAAAAAHCWGGFLFIVKILFLCGIFMCGGNRQGHTSPHTLSRLRYVGILLGGDGNCPQRLWYVNTKNYLAKSMATEAGSILYQSFEDKK